MSELEALMGVFGAIDRSVVADPSLTPDVAKLLCPYDHGSAGWFAPFEEWTIEHGGGRPFPSLEEALAQLSEAVPHGRMLSRRLLAVAVLSRVDTEPALADAAHRALAVEGLAPEAAPQLWDLLADEEVFPDIDHWAEMLQTAFERGLISAECAAQIDPPCAAQVTCVPGNPSPVTTLETTLTIPVGRMTPSGPMTRNQAQKFLDPANWPTCNALWCEMSFVQAVGIAQRYFEKMSLDCSGSAFTLRTVVDFARFNLPSGDGQMVMYRRASDQSLGDGLVTLDEGSIEVRQAGGAGNAIVVKTTKRIQFRYFFDARWLAMFSCVSGYGLEGENLVYNCADRTLPPLQYPLPPHDIPPGGPINVTTGNQAGGSAGGPGARSHRHAHAGQGAPGTGSPDCGCYGDFGPVMADGLRCAADMIGTSATAYRKAMAGTYSAKDMTEDLAMVWTRVLRDGARMASAYARALQGLTATAAPQPPPPPPPPPPAPQAEAGTATGRESTAEEP